MKNHGGIYIPIFSGGKLDLPWIRHEFQHLLSRTLVRWWVNVDLVDKWIVSGVYVYITHIF